MAYLSSRQLKKIRRRQKLLGQEVLMYQRVMEGMRGNLELEGLLKLVINSVRKGLGFKRAGVFLLDPDGKTLRLAVGIDKSGKRYEKARARFPITREKGHDVFSDLIHRRRNYFLTNNLPQRFPGHIHKNERVILNNAAVPIELGGGRVTGVLAVDNLYTDRYITKSDISTLLNYATQVGLAIESFRSHERVLAQAVTDPMTGLYNRRYFDQALSAELGRCRRYRRCCSLILLDIDHFKRVNDTYGHGAGDDIIRQIASLLRGGVRGLDVVARVGGEEFGILLPETPPQNLSTVVNRILKGVREMRPAVKRMQADRRKLTASLGVASYRQGDASSALMMKKADASLYQAKRLGRNRCGSFRSVSG